MKHLLLFSAIAILFSSCGPDLVQVAIDNPTTDFVIVSIDSLTVEVPPLDVAWAEMGKGIHIISAEGQEPVSYDFQRAAYMVNPTMAEYLLYEEVYGSSQFGSPSGTMPVKTITFMGVELEGEYDVVRDLVNPVTWDYGPRETTPEMIEMDEGTNFAFLKKLADFGEVLSMMGVDQPVE